MKIVFVFGFLFAAVGFIQDGNALPVAHYPFAAKNAQFLDHITYLKNQPYGIRRYHDENEFYYPVENGFYYPEENGFYYPDSAFYQKTGFRPYAEFIPGDYRGGNVLVPSIPTIDYFNSPVVGAHPNVGYFPHEFIKPIIAPIPTEVVVPVVVVPSVSINPVVEVVKPIAYKPAVVPVAEKPVVVSVAEQPAVLGVVEDDDDDSSED